MGIGAGDLDRRITIQQFAEGATNDYNETEPGWVDYTTVWARRRDVGDSERLSAGQVNAAQMSRFIIRSSTKSRAVDPKFRLSYDAAFWEILGIKETKEGRNKFLEITAVREAD